MSGIPNPSNAPTKIAAGDTLKFKISDGNYPASDGWTYKFTISNSANLYGPRVSTADGDDHQIEVSETVTAGWVVGEYEYLGFFEHSGGDRLTVHEGRIEITLNPALTTATDLRSHAKKSLDALEAVMESRASLDQMKYQIAGRSLERMTAEDLMKWRDYYRKEVAQEDALSTGPGSGSARSNRIRPRFTN